MEGDDDIEDFSYLTSSAKHYKEIKESFKIDLNSLENEAEDDTEFCKITEFGTKKKSRIRGKKLKEIEPSEVEVEKTTAASDSGEIVKPALRRSRRGAKKTQETPPSPISIPDSPEPPKIVPAAGEMYIFISSDDSGDEVNVSVAEEDENYEMSVKVWWKFASFDKFTIRRYQKLGCLFEHYAKLEGIPQNQILLTLNEVPINPSDTPDSLKMTIVSMIEGGVTTVDDTGKHPEAAPLSEDEIELKVQRKGCKEPLLIRILKTQKMRTLMLKCSENLELPCEKLKFSFDGDILNPNDTPDSLDMEGGECIDLRVVE